MYAAQQTSLLLIQLIRSIYTLGNHLTPPVTSCKHLLLSIGPYPINGHTFEGNSAVTYGLGNLLNFKASIMSQLFYIQTTSSCTNLLKFCLLIFHLYSGAIRQMSHWMIALLCQKSFLLHRTSFWTISCIDSL
jgi:hypothetical protein